MEAPKKPQTLTGFEKYTKTARRAQCLAYMDQIIPWPELAVAVQTAYPKVSENSGRPPIPLERMLRIYFLQLWFNLCRIRRSMTICDADESRYHFEQFADSQHRPVLQLLRQHRALAVQASATDTLRTFMRQYLSGAKDSSYQAIRVLFGQRIAAVSPIHREARVGR
jgi:IS5 family transposase